MLDDLDPLSNNCSLRSEAILLEEGKKSLILGKLQIHQIAIHSLCELSLSDGILIHALHKGEVHEQLSLSGRNALLSFRIALDLGLLLCKALFNVAHANKVSLVVWILDIVFRNAIRESCACWNRSRALLRLGLRIWGYTCTSFLLSLLPWRWLLLMDWFLG